MSGLVELSFGDVLGFVFTNGAAVVVVGVGCVLTGPTGNPPKLSM